MVTRLVLEYPVTLVLLVTMFILVLLLLRKLRNFMNLYSRFPTYPILSELVASVILGKIPQHSTFNGYILRRALEISMRFQKEGMFLVWIFQPHLFIFGEEAVKIFSNEPEALDKSYKYDLMKDLFGSGILTSNSQAWKKQRKLLNPAFHLRMLKSKTSSINENTEVLVKKLEELKDTSSIEIIEYLKSCTFANMCEYILRIKMNSPEKKDLREHYQKLLASLGQMLVYRFSNPLLYYRFMMNFTPYGRIYLKYLNDLHSFTKKMVLAMKENIIFNDLDDINKDEATEDEAWDETQMRKSFAHILLEHHLRDPSFTMEDVQSQVTTFMATGYESVAFTINWCLFMLGHHPEVQDQAYNEVESISEGCIKYEDLNKLNYLECVIKETLRLYPSAPLYARRLGKDVQCGKYKVPKDTSIVFFPYALHRNPKIYPDPEDFQPERFMDGSIENLTWNYTPFSEGIRFCIGKRFAMLEIKVVLAHLLRHYQITSLDRKEDVENCWEVVLAPAKPLRFKLTPRN